MMKIGKENEFLFIIQKEDQSNFGSVSIVINNFKLIIEQSGNLNSLLRDVEVFNYNFNNYFEDNFFWKDENYPILENWNKFYNAKTLDDLDDPIVLNFNDLFYRVNISFDSEFFDEFVFIGNKNDEDFNLKIWKKKHADIILDFKVKTGTLLKTFEELEKTLHEVLE